MEQGDSLLVRVRSLFMAIRWLILAVLFIYYSHLIMEVFCMRKSPCLESSMIYKGRANGIISAEFSFEQLAVVSSPSSLLLPLPPVLCAEQRYCDQSCILSL
jgi:hypothetical protein